MKYFLGIWTLICLLPLLFFLFQDKSTKGISIIDLKNALLIFIGGVLLIISIGKGIKYFK